jgi:hypothetical protein
MKKNQEIPQSGWPISLDSPTFYKEVQKFLLTLDSSQTIISTMILTTV